MAFLMEAHAEPLPGYKLIERLGGGGFGEVWKCEAPGGLHKAIKFVYGTVGETATDSGERAGQELKALARVSGVRHPYILSLERYDIVDDQLMIVMELADRNLWDRFKECRNEGQIGIPRVELLKYMIEAAEALDLMNTQYQLQHLDIKPQNLFLVHKHVKVADFGLAKDLEGTQAAMTGGVTPVYAAPETFDGWVTRFSDQYSLAIVYQELLTGKRPFQGTNVRNLIMQHLEADPDVSPLPEHDQSIIARALSKQPKDRYPSCLDMVQELQVAGGPIDAPPASSGSVPTINHLLESEQGTLITTPPPSSMNSPPKLHVPKTGGTSQPRTENWQHLRPGSSHTGTSSVKLSKEDGVLRPALVIGLGGLGIQIVHGFCEGLKKRFDSDDAYGHIRSLGIDIEPEVVNQYPISNDKRALAGFDSQNILLTPLQRPSHYFKPKEGQPNVDTWLVQEMLYRIPRDQRSRGARALGRLGLVDNFRSVVKRLQSELDACLSPQALTSAFRSTRLKAYSAVPQVYVVSSLCGGTGSGMVLDIAYIMRHLLRQFGFENPDVIGLLLAPGIEAISGSRHGSQHGTSSALPISMGNSCAALTELYHYSIPNNTFTARYLNKDGWINDGAAPFGRCYLLPLPQEKDKTETKELIDMTGQFLARQLFTGLGRTLSQSSQPDERGMDPTYRTFGLHQLIFPRTQIIDQVATRLCETLVTGWMSKDGERARPGVESYLEERWPARDMTADSFITELQERLNNLCETPALTQIDVALDPLLRSLAEISTQKPQNRGFSLLRSKEKPKYSIDTQLIREAFQTVQMIVGKPGSSAPSDQGDLCRFVKEAAASLNKSWEKKLAVLPVKLIEKPGFRLAGAEEALRMVIRRVDQSLEQQESLMEDRLAQARETHERLCTFLGKLKDLDHWSMEDVEPLKKLVDLLRTFGKVSYQYLILEHVNQTCISLRGGLNESLREINFCRDRLGELKELFSCKIEKPKESKRSSSSSAKTSSPGWYAQKSKEKASRKPVPFGRYLFPEGCSSLTDAVDQIVNSLSAADLLELETRAQRMIRKQFRALVEICLGAKHVTVNVEAALRRVCVAYLDEWMHHADVAELLLDQNQDGEALKSELLVSFEEAMPEPVSRFTSEIEEECLLLTPDSAGGEYLRSMAEHAVGELKSAGASTDNEVLVYREWTSLPILELEQLGAVGQDAYNALCQLENYTPHSRMDVPFQVPVEISESL